MNAVFHATTQAPFPMRKIGPILAASTENVGQAVSVLFARHGARVARKAGFSEALSRCW